MYIAIAFIMMMITLLPGTHQLLKHGNVTGLFCIGLYFAGYLTYRYIKLAKQYTV